MRWCKYLLVLVVASSSLCLSSGTLELSLLPFYASPDSVFSPFRSYFVRITGESEALFSWFSGTPSGCLPLPEDSKNVLVIIDDEHPNRHQTIMLLPVNKEELISTFVFDDDTDVGVTPLPCDQDACIAWDYNRHVSVLDLSQAVPEPATFETKVGRAWEVIRTMGQNGDIIYQWYDQDGHLHTLSEWELQRLLSMYFQSLLECLYPEFFGSVLPAGGGWHRWQYRNVRKASDRPGKSDQSLWRGQGRGEQGRGQQWHSQRRQEGTKPVAVVKPVPAGHTRPQPDRQQRHHYRRNEASGSSADEKGSIDVLLTEFEGGRLQTLASRHGQKYDGIKHSCFCNEIKKLTQARKAPLYNEEKHRFEPFMKHLSRVVYSFNSKSLSTCFHSLTVSGVLDPHPLKSVRMSQQHLSEKLLDAIKLQARGPGEQASFDAWAVSNQLWGLAKLVERKVITPEQVSPAVTALLPQVQNHQTEFNPQAVANQLWALAKLVEPKVITTEQASSAVTALLPQVLKHQAKFSPQAVANQLWALAKLVECKVFAAEQASPAVTALLPQVQHHQAEFKPQGVANQLWALAKLEEREVLTLKQASLTVTALSLQVQNLKVKFKHQEIASQLWALAKLVERKVLTPKQANPSVMALLPQVQNHQAEFKPQDITIQLWALAKLVERKVLTPKQTSQAITALLPQVLKHQAEFNPQAVANQLWALAKLVEREVLTSKQANPAVTALSPQVQNLKVKFNPQEIANQLWALAKLVEREVLTPKQTNPSVTALLPQVQHHQAVFKPQEIANQLWALAKLVETEVFTTEQASPAVTGLLPQVQKHQAEFNPQAVANQLWALAKLVEREVHTPEQTSLAVTALLPQVQYHQAEFNPQGVANQLWALAKLVEGEVLTLKQVSPAVTALLPQVQHHQAKFKPQGTANQLWALAKLVEREVLTLKQVSPAVTSLLQLVQYHQSDFTPQHVANQLWALAKLVEREVLTLKQVSPAVTALLPQVQNHQAEFTPQAVANQLWALAKLVEREVITLKQASPAVTALLPQVQHHQTEFKPQGVANQLWALATFGDWVMLDTISNVLGMLDIDAFESLQSQQMALWALTVFLARGLDQAAIKSSMMKLYRTLKDEEKKDSSEKRATILRLSGVWLEENLQDLPIPDYKSVVSKSQTKQHRILSHEFPNRTLETEASVDGLPPVDLLFSREKVVVEIQGPHHYLDKEKQIRAGSTLLKTTTYQKLGYKVIEIHASDVAKPEIQGKLREELSIHFSKTEDDSAHNSCDSSDYDAAEEDEEEWFSAEDHY